MIKEIIHRIKKRRSLNGSLKVIQKYFDSLNQKGLINEEEYNDILRAIHDIKMTELSAYRKSDIL